MTANIGKSEVLPVLGFAVRLASENLESLDEKHREILANEYLRALGRETSEVWGRRAGVIVHSSFRDKSPERFTQADFETLKEAIQILLGSVRSDAVRGTALASLRFVLLPGKQRRQVSVAGSAHDVFLYLLHAALAMSDRVAILFCPECGCAFVAKGKRRFCARPCANRAMYRRWSKRHGPRAVQGKNRKNYANKNGRRKVMTYRTRGRG